MSDWLIGINEISMKVEILRCDDKPNQGSHLIAVRKIHGRKVPKATREMYERVLETIRDKSTHSW